jgi:hypothetical protein
MLAMLPPKPACTGQQQQHRSGPCFRLGHGNDLVRKLAAHDLVAASEEIISEVAVEADAIQISACARAKIDLIGVIAVSSVPQRGAVPVVDFQDIVVQARNRSEVGHYAVLTKIDNP